MIWRGSARTGAIAAAACTACCAPPIFAALGVTAGLAVTAGLLLGLAAAIGIALIGVGWIVSATSRRPRRSAPEVTAVPTPARRSRA